MTEEEWQEKWEKACQPESDPVMQMHQQNLRNALMDYKKKKRIADDYRAATNLVGAVVIMFAIFVIAGMVAGMVAG